VNPRAEPMRYQQSQPSERLESRSLRRQDAMIGPRRAADRGAVMSKLKLHRSEVSFLIKVFEMENLGVLDFSHDRFEAFFKEFGVDIRQPKYQYHGTRDAHLLIGFIQTEEGALAAKVLRRLWDYRAEKITAADPAHAGQDDLKRSFLYLVDTIEAGRRD